MISEELLSEVLNLNKRLNYIVRIKTNILTYSYMNMIADDAQASINIYELAHKCKEWAKDYNYDIWSGWDTDYYVAKVNPDFDDCCDWTEYCNTEPEAIFKACQWILDNKETK